MKTITIKDWPGPVGELQVHHNLPAPPSNYNACLARNVGDIVMHYTGNKQDTARGNAKKPIAPWAEKQIEQVEAAGVMTRDSKGNFRPQSFIVNALENRYKYRFSSRAVRARPCRRVNYFTRQEAAVITAGILKKANR